MYYGFCTAFAYGFEARKMDYAVDFMLRKNFVEHRPVSYVALIESNFFARDFFNPLHAYRAGIVIII